MLRILHSEILQYKERTLSGEEKELCEGLITEEEYHQFLKSMQNGKSPGCDGLTVDFYKFFGETLKFLWWTILTMHLT